MSAAPASGNAATQRLIAIGRRTGTLTPADLQAHLPVASMSAEDIAHVVIVLLAASLVIGRRRHSPDIATGGVAGPSSGPRIGGASCRRNAGAGF